MSDLLNDGSNDILVANETLKARRESVLGAGKENLNSHMEGLCHQLGLTSTEIDIALGEKDRTTSISKNEPVQDTSMEIDD